MCDDDAPDFGPCCICGGACDSAAGNKDGGGGSCRNIVMLSRRGAEPGHGWGCVVCGLPLDGAYAVLCDPCLERWHRDNSLLRTACAGYPGDGRRVLIADLPEGVFDHDRSRHPPEDFPEDFDNAG
jgi:hypothetical protein